MKPSVEFDNTCKEIVMVGVVVLIAQFSRHLSNDVCMKRGVGDMQRVFSQEQVCQSNIRSHKDLESL